MKHISFYILLAVIVFTGFKGKAQTNLSFNSVDSLFHYAEKNSAVIKTGDQQSLLAKWTKLASIGNTINLRSPISASWTDNTEIPVTVVPAENLGGAPGSVKTLTLGQEYVTNYGFTPQIDIINPSAWARIKSASLNVALTETTNLINKRNLFESVAATYYNIVSFQNQIVSVKENIAAADSVLNIVTNKVNAGIMREQDKNNAAVNLYTIQDKLEQLNATLEQQYNSLKLLCDIQEKINIQITDKTNETLTLSTAIASKSSLFQRQQQLQSDYLKNELLTSRLLTFAPTVSFIFNQAWQQSSNSSFFDANSYRYASQYFGLKVTVPFPFDVNKLSQNYTSKIDYAISKIGSEHSNLQNQIDDKQLDIDYQKALSAYTNGKKISELRDINYTKSFNQYKEGILSTENLLLSFTDKVNANLNVISYSANLHYAESKIKINNTIQ